MKRLNHKAFDKFIKTHRLNKDTIYKGMLQYEFYLISKYAVNPFVDLPTMGSCVDERSIVATMSQREFDLLKYFIVLDPENENVSFIEANVISVNNFEQFVYSDSCVYINSTDVRTVN